MITAVFGMALVLAYKTGLIRDMTHMASVTGTGARILGIISFTIMTAVTLALLLSWRRAGAHRPQWVAAFKKSLPSLLAGFLIACAFAV